MAKAAKESEETKPGYVAEVTFRYPADSDNQFIAGSDVSHLDADALEELEKKGHVSKQ